MGYGNQKKRKHRKQEHKIKAQKKGIIFQKDGGSSYPHGNDCSGRFLMPRMRDEKRISSGGYKRYCSAESAASEIVITTKLLHDDPDLDALGYPFNQMSADWGEGDLDGWWRYTIPEKYQRTGGYLPDLVQVYTYCLCKQNNIRYATVLALMEVESGYQYDALSAADDIGYLQVNYKWQIDKMADMKEKALYNPYVNISVGIEYLVELSEEFDTDEAVLTAYHYGPAGAYSRCFNDPAITSTYADKVLEVADRIESELEARENEANEVNGGTDNAE